MLPMLSLTEMAERLRWSGADYSPVSQCNYMLVQLQAGQTAEPVPAPNCPVIGIGLDAWAPEVVDVCVADAAAAEILVDRIEQQPLACAMLVQLLRHQHHTTIEQGLWAESLTYSVLQHSHGFTTWLAQHQYQSQHHDTPLLVQRSPNSLELTLNRPEVHNAFNQSLQQALCEALRVAIADADIQQIVIRGNGESFCAGGDLSEFGQARDAAVAHLSRTTGSAAALMAAASARTVCEVHGACIGAGIELPAFAACIRAHRNSWFQLPEVGLGLIPGAGGTVSISRRIGRRRCAWLALSGARLDAETALAWGLVDELFD